MFKKFPTKEKNAQQKVLIALNEYFISKTH